MLNVRTFCVNPLGENCYILYNENNETAIVDCGAYEQSECEEIASFVQENNLVIKHVLQTHAHFDHIFGLPYLFKKYGVKPQMHENEKLWYEHANEMTIAVLGVGLKENMPEVEAYLQDNQIIELGDEKIKVIHTPGHSKGCICFYNEKNKILFSGDTLFCGSIGRADLEGGNQIQEITSIYKKLMVLPDDVKVFPGHGGPTSIGYERENNYYLK